MKKFLTLLLGLPVILLVNCSDDDEGGEHLAALVGEWMMTVLVVSDCNDATNNGTLDVNNSASFHITINSDGSYTLTGECGNETETGTISSVTATSLTICETGDTDCEADNYVLVGNTLTVSSAQGDDQSGCRETITLIKDMDPADFLEPFVGTWTLSTLIVENCNDAMTDNCTSDCPTLTVAADCSYSFNDGGTNPETGFIIASATSIMICPDNEDCDFGTDADPFTINGTTLSVVTDDDGDFPGCDVTYVLEKQ